MLFQDIIIKKRDGIELSDNEISEFVQGYSTGSIPDYQAASLVMAIFLNGMSGRELATLTSEMIKSGIVVDLSDIEGVKVDKHSTGGVGDKISIPLAPLVAACGVIVPMVSGRGLGHTGGTLDKLESIPGFNVNMSIEEYRQTIAKIGLCMIGQTKELAPADKKIYSLRDATGTVPSIPLISSSIMSKKLAEGIDSLVLDVKTGSGAFMPTLEKAQILARTLVDIGKRSGKRVTAFLTRMDDPLGFAIGNSSEIIESIKVLRGEGPEDVTQLTIALGAEMLILGDIAKTQEEAVSLLEEAISSGAAMDKFRQMIELQGGNPKVIDDFSLFPSWSHEIDIKVDTSGWIESINSTEVGMAGVMIGAGRAVVSDLVDHGVGIKIIKKSGEKVTVGDTVAVLQYNNPENAKAAAQRIKNAYKIGENKITSKPLIFKKIN
jgi:pyrimidine-nucleoside phosphorylase